MEFNEEKDVPWKSLSVVNMARSKSSFTSYLFPLYCFTFPTNTQFFILFLSLNPRPLIWCRTTIIFLHNNCWARQGKTKKMMPKVLVSFQHMLHAKETKHYANRWRSSSSIASRILSEPSKDKEAPKCLPNIMTKRESILVNFQCFIAVNFNKSFELSMWCDALLMLWMLH